MRKSLISIFLFTYSLSNAQNFIDTFRSLLNTHVFVTRFESIETPCYIITEKEGEIIANLPYSNSNFLSNYYLSLKKNNSRLFTSKNQLTGIKCLSEYCSRYMRFRICQIPSKINTEDNKELYTGEIESSYGYPSSSLIQYIGLTYNSLNPEKTSQYFNYFIVNKGSFTIFEDNNKLRIKMTFPDDPFTKDYTFYGYIELVRDLLNSSEITSTIFFDKMSIKNGDSSTPISLKFSSTSFTNEENYFSDLVYSILIRSEKSNKTYFNNYSTWLKHFLKLPICVNCQKILMRAEEKLKIFPSNQLEKTNIRPEFLRNN